MTCSLLTTKRRAQGAPRSLPVCPPALPCGRCLGCRGCLLLALELLACLLGPLLQFVLQLLLLFLELQGINGAGQAISLVVPLSDFAKAYDGPPTDPKKFEEQQKQRR